MKKTLFTSIRTILLLFAMAGIASGEFIRWSFQNATLDWGAEGDTSYYITGGFDYDPTTARYDLQSFSIQILRDLYHGTDNDMPHNFNVGTITDWTSLSSTGFFIKSLTGSNRYELNVNFETEMTAQREPLKIIGGSYITEELYGDEPPMWHIVSTVNPGYISPVPEPSAFLLLAAGLGSLAIWRRRKSA